MKCKFCQNYEISQLKMGKIVTVSELASIFLELQEKNANNINLVTGCIYVPMIVEALKQAKMNGLNIPVIYNSSGYEKVETLQKLNGFVDIYLPDLKYYYDDLAQELSGIKNYFAIATAAIKEMYNQVGGVIFNDEGMIQKGLIIRHLILPNHIQNSKQVLKWIKKNINPAAFVSIMAQYFPEYNALEREDINRKITKEEYEEIEQYLMKLNFENGYMQDFSEENEMQYVPKWEI